MPWWAWLLIGVGLGWLTCYIVFAWYFRNLWR